MRDVFGGMLQIGVERDDGVERRLKGNSIPVRNAAPLPRLAVCFKTRAPSDTASKEVLSIEPSSTTKMFPTGRYAATPDTTAPMVALALNAGISAAIFFITI